MLSQTIMYILQPLTVEERINAIPRECMAEIVVAADKTAEVKAAIENAAKEIKEEFATSDADLSVL